MKIRLGTTFSGIGSVEHALERLGVKYDIIFACDNGGINIFKKNIVDRYRRIYEEITYLEGTLKSFDTKDVMIDDFENKLQVINHNFNELKNKTELEYQDLELQTYIDLILSTLKAHNDYKYKEFYELSQLDISDYLYLVTELKKYKKLKVLGLDKAINYLELIAKNKIYRISRRETKAIIKSIEQLHEEIETYKTNAILQTLSSYDERVNYINKLYKEKEKSNFVKKSYLSNYKINPKDFHWNISLFDATYYQDKIDLYVGGSPCQSFSIVGKRGGFKDTRGTLFYDYVRVLKETQPRFFIYENVKGVLNHDNGKTWEVMQNTFKETGYSFKSYILNAKDFGVPQHRERLFVIGFKNKNDYNKFKDPEKVPLESTLFDYLEDNVEDKYYLPPKGLSFVTDAKNIKKKYTQVNGQMALCQKANQQFNWHGDFIEVYTTEKLKGMQKIDNKYFLSDSVKKYVLDDIFYMNKKPSEELVDLKIARPLTATMHKMHRAGVDNYITYGDKLPVEKRRIRKLTPRECFRLMGFCDSFKFVVSDTQLYQQSGNSIVVDVLMEIIQKIVDIDK